MSLYMAHNRQAGGSSCDLNNHDACCSVSRTSVKGMLGFGAEVDGQADPMDDPEDLGSAHANDTNHDTLDPYKSCPINVLP